MDLSSAFTNIIGKKAFDICMDRIFATSETFWLKLGHNKFFTGNYTEGELLLRRTHGKGKNRQRGAVFQNGYQVLKQECLNKKGGAFYLPGKPDLFPTKEECAYSNDIGAEMDDGSKNVQKERIQSFINITGLIPDLIIDSGGKSLHPHWRSDRNLPTDLVVYLKRLLTMCLLSDPAITNPHQPMRIAGFFRKEKNKEQALLFHSENKYTYQQFIDGFKKFFAHKGIKFPERITDEWWRERDGMKAIIDASGLTHGEKWSRLKYILEEGPEGHERRASIEQEERRRKKEQRLSLPKNGNKVDLVDLIKQASDRLGKDGFDWPGHHWQHSGDKARGNCPWHDSKSGTSGWISPPHDGHEWGYACPVCTDNRPINLFTYWWWLKNGLNAPYPKGKEFVEAAKEFCHWAGVDVPEEQGWDPREPNWDEYQAYVQQEEEQEKIDQIIDDQSFKLGLIAKLRRLGRGYLKGFQINSAEKKVLEVKLPEIITYDSRYSLPSPNDYKGKKPPVIQYNKGERLEVITGLNRKGWKFIWDKSTTGLGKSHQTGLLHSEEGKVWYIDKNHRNVSTATVQEFEDLPPRHNGLYQDIDGKVKRSGKVLVEESNCCKTEDFLKLQNKGYFLGSAKSNPICRSCQFFEGCESSHGVGYGYRYLRKQALTKSRIRCHPGSMPPELNYYSDVAIVEEASKNLSLHQTFTVTLNDLANQIMSIKPSDEEIFGPLSEIYEWVKSYFRPSSEIPRYGVNKRTLMEQLPEQIKEVMTQEFIEKIEKQKLIVDVYEHLDEIQPNFLIPLLKILSGEKGSIRITKSALIVTTFNSQLAESLQEMKMVALLDATAYKPALATQLDIPENQIIAIEEIPPKSNLILHQVEMPGLGSNDWSNSMVKRIGNVASLLTQKYPDLSCYALKKYCGTLGFDRWWFNHNRGDNQDSGKSAIAAFGTPYTNYGAVEDEFFTLGLEGDPRAYYKYVVQAEITQLIGRLRSHRYEGRTFHIYLFGTELDLSFLEEEHQILKQHISEICLEGDSEYNQTTNRLFKAAHQLLEQEVKITQKAIAGVLDITQAAVSQQLKVRNLSTQELACISDNISPPIKKPNRETYILWSALEQFLVTLEKKAFELSPSWENFLEHPSLSIASTKSTNLPTNTGSAKLPFFKWEM